MHRALDSLTLWDRNYNMGDVSSILISICRFGFNNPLRIWNDTVIAGNHTLLALREIQRDGYAATVKRVLPARIAKRVLKAFPEHPAKIVLEGGVWHVPVDDCSHLTYEEVQLFAIADNAIRDLATPDADALGSLLADLTQGDVDLLAGTGLDADTLNSILADGTPLPFDDDVPYVPDAVYPTNNEWGIPVLDLAMQATVIENPLGLWGSEKRTAKGVGTYFFYVDDYRFSALWKDPAPVVASGVRVAIEPNYSVYSNTPAPLALWHTYQKRWLAKYWQTCGIRIVVDLNVSTQFEALNLLGVPKQWRAYACNGGDNELTLHRYRLAEAHAEIAPALFVVYGGGKDAKAQCLEREWVYIPEFTERRFTHGKE